MHSAPWSSWPHPWAPQGQDGHEVREVREVHEAVAWCRSHRPRKRGRVLLVAEIEQPIAAVARPDSSLILSLFLD